MSKNFYPHYTSGQLDPDSLAILQQIESADMNQLYSMTPDEARENFLIRAWLGEKVESVSGKDISISNQGAQLSARVYIPEGTAPFPILIYFHGGGFVLGNLDEFEPFCTMLADGASCIVISVDYRLAPENKYPSAVEDVKTIFEWINKNAATINGDSNRIAVGGDSAGGNLSVVASLLAKELTYPKISKQILICPWLNLASTDTDSYKYFGDGLWLSKKSIYWYRDHYVQNVLQAELSFVSPYLEKDLSGLPSTFILTAEFDVLRDEGESFAQRLRNENIDVKCTRYDGMLHDFVTLPGLFKRANDAISEICSELKNTFSNK